MTSGLARPSVSPTFIYIDYFINAREPDPTVNFYIQGPANVREPQSQDPQEEGRRQLQELISNRCFLQGSGNTVPVRVGLPDNPDPFPLLGSDRFNRSLICVPYVLALTVPDDSHHFLTSAPFSILSGSRACTASCVIEFQWAPQSAYWRKKTIKVGAWEEGVYIRNVPGENRQVLPKKWEFKEIDRRVIIVGLPLCVRLPIGEYAVDGVLTVREEPAPSSGFSVADLVFILNKPLDLPNLVGFPIEDIARGIPLGVVTRDFR